MNLQLTAAVLIALFALPGGAGCASPVPGDFNSIHDCMQYVNTSPDPRAIVLRTEISNGPADLAIEEKLATEKGIPLRVDTTMPPPDRNAATLYSQWYRLQRVRNYSVPNYAAVMSYRFDYTPEQLNRVRQITNDHQEEFDLLDKAINQPVWAGSPYSFSKEFLLREGAREIEMESYMLANDGHFQKAITDQALGFKIANQLQQRPTIARLLTANAVIRITQVGLVSIMYQAGPNAAVDTQIRQTVEADAPGISLKSSLEGSVGYELFGLEKYSSGTPSDIGDFVQNALSQEMMSPTFSQGEIHPVEREFCDKLLDATEAQYVESLLKCIAAVSEPPAARRAAFATVGDEAGTPGNLQSVYFLSLLGGSGPAPEPAWAKLEGADQTNEEVEAETQIILAAAAVEGIRSKAGAFPASLPSGYTDPFTDKPLGYRREGKDGFVVYSVGKDGTFHGGTPGKPYDWRQLCFRYPSPPKVPVPAIADQ